MVHLVSLLKVYCVSAVSACRLGGAYCPSEAALGSPPEFGQAIERGSRMACHGHHHASQAASLADISRYRQGRR